LFFPYRKKITFIGLNAKIVQTLLNNIIVMLSYEKIQFFVRIALIGIVSKFKKKQVIGLKA